MAMLKKLSYGSSHVRFLIRVDTKNYHFVRDHPIVIYLSAIKILISEKNVQ